MKTKKAVKPNIFTNNRVLAEIDNIDIIKNAIKIIENPEVFFNKYFNKIKDPAGIVFAKFAVLIVMKEMDSSTEASEITVDHFSKKIHPIKWLDTLISFYEYMTETATYILDNHNNVILDLYNAKEIDGKLMKMGMKSFAKVQENIIQDVAKLKEVIADIEEEKKRIGDMEDIDWTEN